MVNEMRATSASVHAATDSSNRPSFSRTARIFSGGATVFLAAAFCAIIMLSKTGLIAQETALREDDFSLPSSALTAVSASVPIKGEMRQKDPFQKEGLSAYGKTNTSDASGRKSLSSYSFDSREWVDSYSQDRMENRTDGLQSVSDLEMVHSFSSDRVSSVEEKHPGEIRIASAVSGTVAKNIDGRVSLGLNDSRLLRTQRHIDLTPSYSKQLKYVEICGLVVVQADFPLTEIKSILKEIEMLQRDLTLYMGVPQAEEKIELCLFKDEKSFQKFLRERFPKAPRDRRALYIKLNNEPGTLLVQRSKEFEIDLRHEMTHAIVHASISIVPIWLDEGLAKYFEVPVDERSEKNPYIKAIRWNVKFGAVPSLRRLERLENIGEMGNREYRDSWAWVHFMIHHSPETHRLLAGYLQLLYSLQQDADQGKAIRDQFDLPTLAPYLNDVIPKSREQYREHFQTWGVEKEH